MVSAHISRPAGAYTFQLDLIVVSRASDKTGSFLYNYFVTGKEKAVFSIPGDAIKFSNYSVLKGTLAQDFYIRFFPSKASS